MCIDGKLKDEFKHLESTRLVHAIHFPQNFKTSWFTFALRKVHDMCMWLDEPIKITKDFIHMVIGYPIINKVKTIKTDPKNEIEENTKARWDKRGLKVDTIQILILSLVCMWWHIRYLNIVGIIVFHLWFLI